MKYSDKGAKPATGRSGSAQIAARALLGKDGTTDLEITTGELDSATAGRGVLSKTQVKVLSATGESLFTRNDKPDSEYVRYAFPSWGRGLPLRVQANVRGVDVPRVDVITVSTSVKLRPDPSITSLDAPARALVGDDVTIVAALQELNGDVGARGTCVLRVDGVVTDSATNVWVDAGGTVACAFSHSFPEAGKHSFAVALLPASVVPADYEPTNNELTGQIEVDAPAPPVEVAPLQGGGQIFSSQSSNSARYDFWYAAPFDRAPDGHRELGNSVTQQSERFNVWAYRALRFPIDVAVVQSTDEGVVRTESLTIGPGKTEIVSGKGSWSERTCASAFIDGASYRVCTEVSHDDAGAIVKQTTC